MNEYLPFNYVGCCDVKNISSTDESYIQIIGDGLNIDHYDLFSKINQDLNGALKSGFEFKNNTVSNQKRLKSVLMESNISRFSSAKTLAQLSEINKVVKSGASFSEIKKKVSSINNQFNVDWLRTEVSTARATSLSVSDWVDNSEEFKYARWIQIQRETKRESHTKLNGKIWESTKIPAIPPLDWNCGCRIEYLEDFEVEQNQVQKPSEFVDILKASESTSKKYANLYDQMKRYGFNKHKGKIGEVFAVNKTYGKEFDANRLTWKNQGLKTSTDIPHNKPLIRNTSTYKHVKSNQNRQLIDYNGRLLDNNDVINTSNYRLSNNIDDVLSKPDEVFMRQIGDKYRYTYIKYYDDFGKKTSLIVEAEVNSKSFKLKSFKKNSRPNDKRNGINVFNAKNG